MKQLTDSQRAATDARRTAFRALAGRLAAMPEAERATLAQSAGSIRTVEGHSLSVKNSCLLLMQIPGVSMVGGFRQWIKAGRAVRKGEHGACIWAASVTGEGDDEETRFLTVTVFDVSQTDALGTSPGRQVVLAAVAAPKPSEEFTRIV